MTAVDAAGLTTDQVADRVAAGRVNRASGGTERTVGQILRANLFTPVNTIMVTLFVLILVAGYPRDGLFVGVVVTNVVIGTAQELRARHELRRLAVLNAAPVRVRRDADTIEIDASDLVVDDLVLLGSGEQVPADGRVVTSVVMTMDESLLTGESDSIPKAVDDEVRSGSFVAAGSGSFRVEKVGDDSYANQLAAEAKRFVLVGSELRRGIDRILRALMIIIPPVALLLWFSLLQAEDRWQDALQGTVAAAVAMVPDGLVLLTSLAFVAGVIALARRQALAKELATVELLARVDMLCLDKTGTITTGEISFADAVPLGGTDPDRIRSALAALGHTDPDPNATMRAVRDRLPDSTWERIATQPFSSATKWSGAEFAGEGAFYLGAADVLFAGDDTALELVDRHTSEGRRVLGLAHGSTPLGTDLDPAQTPMAVVLFEDTIRPNAVEILGYFADQGVAIKVISGDSVDTVAAVAQRAGVRQADRAIDARELPDADGGPDQRDRFVDAIASTTVFGGVTPHQKRAMVAALQERGHVVAMTGDGVNDVLALKDADMGISMGSGSPATRGVAQLVLMDDRFSTLPVVLAQGRRVINNIERVANLFVTKAVYAVLLALLIGIQQIPFPLLPRQLTLIGTFSIGVPGAFLALAPTDALVRPGFLGRVLRFSIPAGMIAGSVTWTMYALAEADDDVSLESARSIATITLLLLGLVVLVVASRPLRLWKIGLAAGMAGMYTVILVIEPLREFFALTGAPGRWWGYVAVATAIGGTAIALLPTVIRHLTGDSDGTDATSPDGPPADRPPHADR